MGVGSCSSKTIPAKRIKECGDKKRGRRIEIYSIAVITWGRGGGGEELSSPEGGAVITWGRSCHHLGEGGEELEGLGLC